MSDLARLLVILGPDCVRKIGSWNRTRRAARRRNSGLRFHAGVSALRYRDRQSTSRRAARHSASPRRLWWNLRKYSPPENIAAARSMRSRISSVAANFPSSLRAPAFISALCSKDSPMRPPDQKNSVIAFAQKFRRGARSLCTVCSTAWIAKPPIGSRRATLRKSFVPLKYASSQEKQSAKSIAAEEAVYKAMP